MNLISNLMSEKYQKGGNARFIQTSANLKVNSFLFDVRFNNSIEGNTGVTSWDFLKNFMVNIALRLGGGNGSAVNLVSNVPLYQILELSDEEAGVSMESTDFSKAGMQRISGEINIGYFGMGSRDALDVQVTVNPVGDTANVTDVEFIISAVYENDKPTAILTLQSAKPTGADQPYTNVLRIFYDSPTFFNATATIKDKLSTQSVNLEDAIAHTNAVANFEFFTRFGKLFEDPYGLSRDVSFNIPKVPGADDGEVLIQSVAFFPELLEQNNTEDRANRDAYVAEIKANSAEKYQYLSMLGLV